jgi:hypothetical protein
VTLKEFQAGTRSIQRSVLTHVGIIIASIIIYGVGFVVFFDEIQVLGTRAFGPENKDAIRPLLMVPVVLYCLGGGAYTQWRAKRDRRMICPHCGKLLVTPVAARFAVMATCNCPFCGKRAIQDVESEASTSL